MECLKCGSMLSGVFQSCPKCGVDLSPQPGGHTDPHDRPSETLHFEPEEQQPPHPGRIIAGRWELVEERGRGGMGIVYRGGDTRLSARTVAVKLLREHLQGSSQGIERFLREAQTVAGLSHQAIVQVFDVGEDSGHHYIVMEWVDGEDLEKQLERDGAKPLDDALSILKQVFQGVSYAHRHGVIHRDIKPSNILITEDGRAKLVDFGLARIASESELSQTGYGLGTLAYMPPEQRRDAKRADHRSDIYALGKTVYHILTGRIPDPVDPDAMPAAVRSAVMRSLKPEPADRWFSVDEFWEAIEAGRSGDSILGGQQMTQNLSRDSGTASSVTAGSQVSGILAFTCPDCSFANPKSARFCKSCGIGLFEKCPKCGFEDRVGTEFCGSCGVNTTQERQYQDHIGQARKLLDRHQYSRARKEAELALSIRADDPDAAAMAADAAEKQASLDRIRRDLDSALKSEEFDRAEDLVEAGLRLSPRDEALLDALTRMPELKARTAERSEHDRLASGLQRSEESGLYSEAVSICEELIARKPDDPRLTEKKRELDDRIRSLERRMDAVKSLRREHRYEEALSSLKEMMAECPQDRQLRSYHEETAAEQKLVEDLLSDARRSLDKGAAAVARRHLAELGEIWPDEPRAAGLNSELEALSARLIRTRRRQALLAACVIALAALIVLWVTTASENRRHLDASRMAISQGDHEEALQRLMQSRGIGVSSGQRREVAEEIGTALLATEASPRAGDRYWTERRQLYERVAELKEAPEASAAAERKLTELEAGASETVRSIVTRVGELIGLEDFDGADSEIARIAVIKPGARQTADSLSSRSSTARHAAGLEQLAAQVQLNLAEETPASLEQADSLMTRMADMAPSDQRVMEFRRDLESLRETLDRRSAEQSEATSLVSSIETNLSARTHVSLAAATSALKRLKQNHRGHGRISSLDQAVRELRSALPPQGTHAGQESVFEIFPGVRMAFVWIPAGRFRMGSDPHEIGRNVDEEPAHEVRISKGFWLGRYEVTQGEWQAVMGGNPSSFTGNPRLPVEQVSWNDAMDFIARLTDEWSRLPTEAEWEYACRAGTATPFHTGSCLPPDDVNYDGTSPYGTCPGGTFRRTTTQVGSFGANAWGLYDMHGNVSEWCSDGYGATYYEISPGEDPAGPPSGAYRVLRGGSWQCRAAQCRSAHRTRSLPAERLNTYGFRLARTVP